MLVGPAPTRISPQFTLKQISTVFRAITEYINDHPDSLKEQGVFSVASTESRKTEIVENILRGNPFVRPEYEIHDYLGALKLVTDSGVFSSLNPIVNAYQQIINATNQHNPAQLTLGKAAVETFIGDLIRSGDPDNMLAAEIVYSYFYLMKKACAYSDTNKMNENSLANIMMMSMTNSILPESAHVGPIHAAIYEKILETDVFLPDFDEKYGSEVAQFKQQKASQKIIDIEAHNDWMKNINAACEGHAKINSKIIETINEKSRTLRRLAEDFEKRRISKEEYKIQSMECQKSISDLESELNQHRTITDNFIAELKRGNAQIKRIKEDVDNLRRSAIWHTEKEQRSRSRSPSPSSTPSSPLSVSSSPDTSPRQSPLPIMDLRQIQVQLLQLQRQEMTRSELIISLLANEYADNIKNGVKQLKSDGFTSQEIGPCLYALRNQLDPEDLGETIGKDTNVDILESYTAQMNFKGMQIGEALRTFVEKGGFKLPGEAQVIGRYMEAFGKQYIAQNPGMPFTETPEKPFQIAFATMMLHSDLHNPQVKSKMSKDQFIKNQILDNFYHGEPEKVRTHAKTAAATLFDYIKHNKFEAFDTSKKSESKSKRKSYLPTSSAAAAAAVTPLTPPKTTEVETSVTLRTKKSPGV